VEDPPVTDQRPTFLGAVGRFFFWPADPTALGFMRILTGLVVLYVHAAYTPDLAEFMGPNAWWDHQAGNQQRRQTASRATPLSWRLAEPTLKAIDDVPHRRSAEVEYMRRLPLAAADRKAQLRYLERLLDLARTPPDLSDPARVAYTSKTWLDGMYFVNAATHLDSERKARVREVLGTPNPDEIQAPLHFPDFIRPLPPAERQAVWDDLLVFAQTLPSELDKMEYVLHWLNTYPMQYRPELVRFLVGEHKVDGRDLSLPADPRERDEFLDYLNLWGGDVRQADDNGHDKGTAVFSVWYHLQDPASMYAVHAAFLAVCVLFTIGLWTRVTSVLVWAGTLNYIHRGQLVLFGQDTMQTILLMYLMIGPSGAALSVDALRKRFRAARTLLGSPRQAAPWAEAALAGPPRSWLANLALRLFQINFCIIYASAGLSKLKGSTWWEHSAPWLLFANPEFGLIRYPAYEWALRLVSESRLLIAAFAASVTMFTLFVELGFPVLVWTRLRALAVSCSALLHLGIAVFMGLAVFGLYMFVLLLCYFPARLIRDRVCVTPGTGQKMILRYDSKDPKSVTAAARVRALDLAGQVTFVDETGKGAGTRFVVDGHEHPDLTKTALRQLALLRPVRWLAAVV
jgi:hypothetical protein